MKQQWADNAAWFWILPTVAHGCWRCASFFAPSAVAREAIPRCRVFRLGDCNLQRRPYIHTIHVSHGKFRRLCISTYLLYDGKDNSYVGFACSHETMIRGYNYFRFPLKSLEFSIDYIPSRYLGRIPCLDRFYVIGKLKLKRPAPMPRLIWVYFSLTDCYRDV